MFMADLLPIAYEARKHMCFCALGPVGIGKTAELFAFAEKMGVNYEEINVSQMAFNEVAGMTMPDEESKSMRIYDYERLTRLKDGDILFLDELLTGSEQTLAALLKLVEDRRLISGRKLPDIMIIAAANPLPSPTMLPLSIRQRFHFVDVTWNDDGWREYINGVYGIRPTDKIINIIREEVTRAADNNGNWNVLSPRTATKLIDFFMCNEDIGERFDSDCLTRDLLLSRGHGSTFIEWVMKAKRINADREQLMTCLKTFYADREIPPSLAGINDLDNSELLGYLSALPEWDKLKELLGNVAIGSETDTGGYHEHQEVSSTRSQHARSESLFV